MTPCRARSSLRRRSAQRLTRTAVTGPDGGYSIPALPPGTYRIRAELSGFRTLIREGVRIATGETVRLDLQLQLGSVTEAVTVTADAPLLRSGTSGLGHVIDNRKIVDLPLNGRSFIALASLAPGVAVPPPPAAPLPRINGGRPRTNEYLFDGISVLQPEPGQVAFFPNVDAIQEFKIESNSPPAEFGRFNGGVVNLTTKSGSNAFRGTLFEFARHEALNARNFFASSNPVKPQFRRNQFGGVLGGPIRRDRTFFFLDYQGQRQTIGRTVISTVPTLLQRQGIFTEAIGGRVPAIYDPATTLPVAGGVTRTPFSGNTIPVERMDPVARALLERYPVPTSAGTANNYRRTENETVDQDQVSLRIDHRFTNRDQVFGRLTRFQEEFLPVTPLPDGSGVTTGTLGPQDTTSWSFASSYQRTFSSTLLNELRIGDTRRAVGRTAAQLSTSASSALNLPGIPATAKFPNTLPTFLIGGYQQLGSPSNTATDFSTSVTEIADTLTWLKGRHTIKVGADLRWERLNVLQPPAPTGSFTFSNLFSDLPGTPNTGTPLASFLLGQVQQFSIDLQEEEIRNRAHFQEYFVQDDWRLSESPDGQCRRPVHAELPIHRREQPGGRLQSGDAAARVSRPRRPATCRPAAAQAELRAAARDGRTHHRQDRRARRLWSGLDRDGGHHDAVHDTGLSVPPDRVAADAGQHHARIHARGGSQCAADPADTRCRHRPGRLLG